MTDKIHIGKSWSSAIGVQQFSTLRVISFRISFANTSLICTTSTTNHLYTGDGSRVMALVDYASHGSGAMAEIWSWKRPKTGDYPKVWRRFQGRTPFPNGKLPKFRIQDMTEDLLEDAIQLMVKHYIPEEPLSKSLNFKSDPLAVEEMKEVWRAFFKYKMALIGILENRDELGDETLPAVIGCNMTGVLLKGRPAVQFKPKSKKASHVFDILTYLHDKVDVFEHYQTSEILYALGLSVHSRFRGQGIGFEFMRARLELGKSVGLKATVTVFSNITSQTVAEQAGFENLFEIMYDEYLVDNEPIFNKTSTKSCKLMGMKIM